MFPNFLNQCLSLKSILTPIAYLLITGGFIAATLAGYQSGSTHFRSIGRIIVLLMLLVFLPTWGNQVSSIVSDLVTNTLNVDPAKIHDQYQAALQLKKSSDGNSSWWEKVFDFPSIMEALVSAVFLILGWLASTIEWWAYILQSAILFIGYALSPIFVGMLMFHSVEQIGRRYLLNLLGIMIWPLGWGVAGLITQGMISFMTDQSFLSSQSAGGDLGYSLQNLMGLAFLGIWIIFSTIAAPVIIQRAIATGSSVGSDLLSGGFAAGSAAGMAGIMSLAGSIGGMGINRGTFTLKGLGKAAVAGGSAGMAAAMTGAETLVTNSMNGGSGGMSLIGSLTQAKNRSENGNASFPANDPSGDKTVEGLIRKSKNPES
ncbi:MAG TPA: hypothetical protein VGY56_07040 [Verrucomicrobiae bacterium]|nr:hypothetical protein [Verrucomicrobiae bacterium]